MRGVAHIIIHDKSSGGGQVTLARLTARAADGNAAAAAASLPREENRQLKSVVDGSAPPTVTGLRTADYTVVVYAAAGTYASDAVA